MARKLVDRARAPLTLGAVALAAVVAGCGGGDGGSDLAQYLPADTPLLTQVDLGQAREQLELPDDADALDFEAALEGEFDPDSPEGTLLTAALIGMPPLTGALQTFEDDPVSAAFDGTAISAAATTLSEGGSVTAIRTGQSFDDLASALEPEGYERDGDALVNDEQRLTEIADAGDGILLLAEGSATASDAAADPPGGPTELIELLEPADEPIAQGVTSHEEDCITAYGGWENATFSSGTISVALDREADTADVDAGQLEDASSITLEEPTADGETVNIGFSADRDPPTSLIRALVNQFGSGLYSC
jgi:hypothetical protein